MGLERGALRPFFFISKKSRAFSRVAVPISDETKSVPMLDVRGHLHGFLDVLSH